MRVTNAIREACLQILDGAADRLRERQSATLSDLLAADLAAPVNFSYELTDAGRELARAWRETKAARAKSRARAARGRSEAMRSLGLKRTRSGAWE